MKSAFRILPLVILRKENFILSLFLSIIFLFSSALLSFSLESYDIQAQAADSFYAHNYVYADDLIEITSSDNYEVFSYSYANNVYGLNIEGGESESSIPIAFISDTLPDAYAKELKLYTQDPLIDGSYPKSGQALIGEESLSLFNITKANAIGTEITEESSGSSWEVVGILNDQIGKLGSFPAGSPLIYLPLRDKGEINELSDSFSKTLFFTGYSNRNSLLGKLSKEFPQYHFQIGSVSKTLERLYSYSDFTKGMMAIIFGLSVFTVILLVLALEKDGREYRAKIHRILYFLGMPESEQVALFGLEFVCTVLSGAIISLALSYGVNALLVKSLEMSIPYLSFGQNWQYPIISFAIILASSLVLSLFGILFEKKRLKRDA